MLRTGLLIVCLLVGVGSGRAALEVELGSSSSDHVFGGDTNTLYIRVTNPSRTGVRKELCYRVFQLSRSLRMPVGDVVRWRIVNIPADSSRGFALHLHLPEVRVATGFQVAWFEESKAPAGDFLVTAHARDLLLPLMELIERQNVVLWDQSGELSASFARLGLDINRVKSAEQIEKIGGRMIICFSESITRSDWQNQMGIFEQLNRRNLSVLCFYPQSEFDPGTRVVLHRSKQAGASTLLAPASLIGKLKTARELAEISQLLTCAISNNPLELIGIR